MAVLLSIITPCLNRASSIEASIGSVLKQGYADFEHIVVDGGSTDGTLDVLARYPHLRVLSGRDSGMYDALNKGLAMASGEVVGFLNADDLYADDVFQPVMEYFHHEKTDAVSGRAQVFEDQADGTQTTVLELSPPLPDKLVETAVTGSTIFNAWFYRKSVIDRVGGFDPRYQISGDADLILRLALKGLDYLARDVVHYRYRQHEASLTFQMDSRKLLRTFRDHSFYIRKYMFSADTPSEVKALFGKLYSDTCLALSRQFRIEGKSLQAFLWRVRASFDVSSPLIRDLVL